MAGAADLLGPKADRAFGLKLVAPAMIILIVLLALPTLLTLVYSLHDVPASGSSFGPFVGLENFTIIFSSPVFWRSAQVTLTFSVGFVILSTVIGLATLCVGGGMGIATIVERI